MDPGGEMADRAANIGGENADNRVDRRREPADLKPAVEEDRRDVGAGQQIAQIVGRRLELLDLALELIVDGVQLLVQRLQLLLEVSSSSFAA